MFLSFRAAAHMEVVMRTAAHFDSQRRRGRGPARITSLFALSLTASLLTAACASSTSPGATPTSAPVKVSVPAAPSTAPSSPRATPSTSASTPHGGTTHSPSAADALAGFFAVADRTDRQIRAAATLVNSGIGADFITFTPATVTAVTSINQHALVDAIPGAMPAALQRKVLLVFSELVSRADALTAILDFRHDRLPRDSAEARFLIGDLGHGAPAAARYPADVSATRRLAASLPPIAPVSPASRAVAAIAVQTEYIMGMNGGCASTGGWLETSPVPLVWKQGTDYSGQRTDGTIGGILFRADYHPGHGWQIQIHAC